MHSTMRCSARRVSFVALKTLLLISSLLCCPGTAAAQDIDVWIDPGHGGKDPGAPGFLADGVHNEKRLAFQVSSSLQTRLGQLGYFALMTRNSDIFWSLADRALIANGIAANDDSIVATAQRLVVIHMNSNKKAQPYGTTTYYQKIKVPPKRADAYRADSSFAETVHQWLINPGTVLAFFGCDSNRTCRPGNWQVTRETSIPSAYIEVCFISNQCQQSKINQQGNQGLVANGIALGINPAARSRTSCWRRSCLARQALAAPPAYGRAGLSKVRTTAKASRARPFPQWVGQQSRPDLPCHTDGSGQQIPCTCALQSAPPRYSASRRAQSTSG